MSSQQQAFTINGLVDTNKSVWANAEKIASASAAWITWDPWTFQYGVVINKPTASTRSFTDDNIIGSITVSEIPFEELYNSCEIKFPNSDIRDRPDYIRYDQPVADRFDFEPDNKLTIEFDFVNNPIQADVIAITELKQSRLAKTVSFTTDFQQLDLTPGDVIDITNEYFDWDQKEFRIVEITQTDTEAGEIFVDIIAVEYSDDTYNYNDLTKLTRTVGTGVPAVKNNAQVQTVSDETVGTQVGRALATDTGKAAITDGGVPVYDSQDVGFTVSTVNTQLNGGSSYGATYQATAAVKNLQVVFEGPYGTVDYDIYVDEVLESRDYVGAVPLTLVLEYSTDNATWSTLRTTYLEFTGNNHIFNITDAAAGYYKITAALVDTLTLDQDVPTSVTTNKAVVDITGVNVQTLDASGDASTISVITLE